MKGSRLNHHDDEPALQNGLNKKRTKEMEANKNKSLTTTTTMTTTTTNGRPQPSITSSKEEDEDEDDEEKDQNEEDTEDDDDVPSAVARSWKAKNKVKSLSEELEEFETTAADAFSPNQHTRQPRHRTKHSNGSNGVGVNGAHTRESSNATAAVAGLPPSLAQLIISPLPSPITNTSTTATSSHVNGGHNVHYSLLSYPARVQYELDYQRRWKPPMALLVDRLLTRYQLLPTKRPNHERGLKHSMSSIDTSTIATPNSVVFSEDFDADLTGSPLGSPPSAASSSIFSGPHHHGVPRHPPRSSSASSIGSASSLAHTMTADQQRDEAERHSLAKGKLKIQAALLRRKQFDWQRRVEAGETTWEALEQEEAEADRKIHERHQSKHRTLVPRIIDPRDHQAFKRADAEAHEARTLAEQEARFEWYWNSIPIAAVAIMRVLIHNHAFDACLPPNSSPLISTPATTQLSTSKKKKKAQPTHSRNGSTSSHRPKHELCRTWLLSDLLYAFRSLLIAVVQNESEPVSPTKIITPRTGGSLNPSPASSPSMRSVTAAIQQTPQQVQARLIWLLNNIVVLLHLTKRFAIQCEEEAKEAHTAKLKGDHLNGDDHHHSHVSHSSGGSSTKKKHYTPHFKHPPAEWSTSIPVDFPSATTINEDGATHSTHPSGITRPWTDQISSDPASTNSISFQHFAIPLSHLSSNLDDYIFEFDYDRTSDNAIHWFYCWLLRLARVTIECLLQHAFLTTALQQTLPAQFLQPTELFSLGSDLLDQLIESLSNIFQVTTEASLLNLLKTQLFQCLMEQFQRGIIQVILNDQQQLAQGNGNAHPSNPTDSSSSSTSPQPLLSQSIPVGMKLSMIYSGLQDWSQRCTSFSHPFVMATRLTLAPLKELCMFCLLDDKSEMESLEEFELLTPMIPKSVLYALCQSYNALPDQQHPISERILKQLKKRMEKDAKEAKEKLEDEDAEERTATSAVVGESKNAATANSTTTHHPQSNGSQQKKPSSLSNTAMPILPPFRFSLDLSSQLGKFLLSAVELPPNLIQAHPALSFLTKSDETLVL